MLHPNSGWRDKISRKSNDYWYFKRLEPKFKKIYLEHKKNDSKIEPVLDTQMITRFSTFLRYVKQVSPFKNINNHFKPISYFCSPCELQFDYISHIDTLSEDLLHIFQDFGANYNNTDDQEILKIIEQNRNNLIALKPYTNGSGSAKKAFRKINSVDPKLIQDIYERFYWDFELFGYEIDEYL